jgi:hypothetical protein
MLAGKILGNAHLQQSFRMLGIAGCWWRGDALPSMLR